MLSHCDQVLCSNIPYVIHGSRTQKTRNIHIGNPHPLMRVIDQMPVMQYQLSPQAPITKPEAGKPAGSPGFNHKESSNGNLCTRLILNELTKTI